MPHDALVLEQACDLPWSVARHLLRIEVVEGSAKCFSLAQDRDPGEPSLESLKHELLEERAWVGLRHPPFLVVISDVERVAPCPRATLRFILAHEAAGAGVLKRAQGGMRIATVTSPARKN